jgi:hypothetical protein
MSEERKKVLTMLAEGTITAEEAERLLQKLAASEDGDSSGASARGNSESPRGSKGAPKDLRVEIHSGDGDQISVRVPLRLIRTGIKLTTMLPSETNAKLADKGIDLSELGKLEGEELITALRELTVNVDSADGDTVRVFCE